MGMGTPASFTLTLPLERTQRHQEVEEITHATEVGRALQTKRLGDGLPCNPCKRGPARHTPHTCCTCAGITRMIRACACKINHDHACPHMCLVQQHANARTHVLVCSSSLMARAPVRRQRHAKFPAASPTPGRSKLRPTYRLAEQSTTNDRLAPYLRDVVLQTARHLLVCASLTDDALSKHRRWRSNPVAPYAEPTCCSCRLVRCVVRHLTPRRPWSRTCRDTSRGRGTAALRSTRNRRRVHTRRPRHISEQAGPSSAASRRPRGCARGAGKISSLQTASRAGALRKGSIDAGCSGQGEGCAMHIWYVVRMGMACPWAAVVRHDQQLARTRPQMCELPS
eukprot:365983-Chlamydomonas_euryale.AAC.5